LLYRMYRLATIHSVTQRDGRGNRRTDNRRCVQ